jgi:hypothetical protein
MLLINSLGGKKRKDKDKFLKSKNTLKINPKDEGPLGAASKHPFPTLKIF